ncbi:dTMP kinase [Persicimonas caeni]|uniref:Thymidylate kinase n=1 Tax=Persicimonas caeni TaxID=2292766 RepID=A0A4Y6PW75_PERCE|nr:dTMP kinase [Persicimonas caeni]QDG52594.1 dTMP kinase [Persicimonas caeni]QED33816.1 dTMP kinase [Persicimonas caeni]
MADLSKNAPFVVIEGLDGAGTTTQTALLVERLQATGQEAISTREPSDGPVGVLIRQMLSKRVVTPRADGSVGPVGREVLALLFAADRLDHVEAEIEPALAAGKAVISDRYYHSSFAYQGDVDASDHFDIDWVRTLNERARTPDVTFFLEAPVDLCLSRMSGRGSRDIYETREKLERLERRYAQVMGALEEEGERIVRLDASLAIDELSDAIYAIVTGES